MSVCQEDMRCKKVNLEPDSHPARQERRVCAFAVPPMAVAVAAEGELLEIAIKDLQFDGKEDSRRRVMVLTAQLAAPPAAVQLTGFQVVFEPSYSQTKSGLLRTVGIRL